MGPNPSVRSPARELMVLATEVDSLAKSLARTQEELAAEVARRRRFEQEAVDLAAALGHARQRAATAERELGRAAAELEAASQTAQVRGHELKTRLSEANQTIERLRHELQRSERQRLVLETDLSDVMQNLRHAAAEAALPRPPAQAVRAADLDADTDPANVDR